MKRVRSNHVNINFRELLDQVAPNLSGTSVLIVRRNNLEARIIHNQDNRVSEQLGAFQIAAKLQYLFFTLFDSSEDGSFLIPDAVVICNSLNDPNDESGVWIVNAQTFTDFSVYNPSHFHVGPSHGEHPTKLYRFIIVLKDAYIDLSVAYCYH